MRKVLWIIALVFAASLAPTVLHADNITYGVNFTVGGDTVTGTITTNATIGQLTGSDIIAFSLSDSDNLIAVLNNTNSSVDLNFETTPTFLSANPTLITYDPNGLTTFIIVDPGVGKIGIGPGGTGSIADLATGRTVTGTVSNVIGGVPEINPASAPSALALVAGVVLIIRGRRKIPTPIA
jgi:hypothetical protein